MERVIMTSEDAHSAWGQTIDIALAQKQAVIQRNRKPVAVLVDYEWFEELREFKVKALLRNHAGEIIKRNDANNSWVSFEDLMQTIEETHGPEYIATIKEGIDTSMLTSTEESDAAS